MLRNSQNQDADESLLNGRCIYCFRKLIDAGPISYMGTGRFAHYDCLPEGETPPTFIDFANQSPRNRPKYDAKTVAFLALFCGFSYLVVAGLIAVAFRIFDWILG